MPDTSETNSVDIDVGFFVERSMEDLTQELMQLHLEVRRLRDENRLLQGDKETWADVFDTVRKECDPVLLAESEGYVFRCVASMRAEIERLQKVVADQVLTIGRELKRARVEAGVFSKDAQDWKERAETSRLALDVALKALRWFEEREPLIRGALGQDAPAVAEYELLNPKPGAAT